MREMRERWGTFSVRDHVSEAPLVSDVLLYDRLVLPVPDPAKSLEEQEWREEWKPQLLERCLAVLGVKTETSDGLAITVPWTADKRERFESRMSMAAALATQQRDPEIGYYMDPFHMTRELIRDEFRPALPKGVSKAWTVAAYTSAASFRDDTTKTKSNQNIAALVKQRFLTPAVPDANQELLKRAVDLATTEAFRKKRRRFYAWQEEIIEEDISEEKAIEELDALLKDYNQATSAAFKIVLAKYAFTVIPIGLTMTGTLLADEPVATAFAAASGLVALTRFWAFDRKPVIDNGDLDAAAMFHDVSDAIRLVEHDE
jgi:hypothetical protein